MSEFRAGTAEQVSFLDDLVAAGLLTRTGVDGVYARGAAFEAIRRGVDDVVTEAARAEDPELLSFPPVMSRRELEINGYLGSFPHLAGTVFAFEGDERAAGLQLGLATRHEDWSGFQEMTDLVLCPAACYPVYPAVAERGTLPAAGVTVDTGASFVFRHEPSTDPARMQIFHMRELVRIADRATVVSWRLAWRERAQELLLGLGLALSCDVASDPFFGRAGEFLADHQRDAELKWELVAPTAGGHQTAIASSNYHETHFGDTYSLMTPQDEVAHTGCMAFGEERVTLALLAAHGCELDRWPSEVLDRLGLEVHARPAA